MTPKFVSKNKDEIKKVINRWMSTANTQAVYGSSIFGGGDVKKLEELFYKTFNAKHAVALSSCTAALHTALHSAGVKRNSKVLIINSDWQGIDGVVRFCGATPIRIDKALKINKNQTVLYPCENLSAIIVARNSIDQDLLNTIKQHCDKNKIILIEDYADLKEIDITKIKAPEYGQFATFSFGYDKWIQAGEGGILLCNNFDYYVKAVQFSQHPIYQRARLSAKIKEPVNFGLNYRIHPIAASIALAILSKINNPI